MRRPFSNKTRALIAVLVMVAASFSAILGATALTTNTGSGQTCASGVCTTTTDASTDDDSSSIDDASTPVTSPVTLMNATTTNETNTTETNTTIPCTNETNATVPCTNETNMTNATTENVTVNATLFTANASATSNVVSVEQTEGGKVSWTIPSKRNISAEVFGTPQHPLLDDDTLAIRIQQALSQLPAPLNEKVAKLLQDMPDLVALPRSERLTSANSSFFTTTAKNVSEGEESLPVNGSFNATYTDRQLWDIPGQTTQTDDQFSLSIWFTDPAGNRYEARMTSLYQPHIPAWQTGGGVLTNAWIHGLTGTETPLSPRVYAYGAAWMTGDLWVNGNLTQQNMLMHLMTTQQDETKDDRVALDDQLPLLTNDSANDQIHHTIFEVMPIHVTDQGPEHTAVNTSYTVKGKLQDFISVAFDSDTILTGPTWEQPSFTPFKAFSPTAQFIQNLTQPSITITSPIEGQTLSGTTIPIRVQVRNFDLQTEGRIVYLLDQTPLTTGTVKETSTSHITTQTAFSFRNIAAGTHTVTAMLVDTNNQPLVPSVTDTVTITLGQNASGAPSIKIVQPTPNARLRTDCLAVSVEVTNFNLGPQGRLLVALDFNPVNQTAPKGARFTVTTQTTVEFEHVTPGPHRIFAELVTPSREILTPPVVAQGTVNIAP